MKLSIQICQIAKPIYRIRTICLKLYESGMFTYLGKIKL